MALWTKLVLPLIEGLRHVEENQLIVLAIKCSQHALERNRAYFMRNLSTSELDAVDEALRHLVKGYSTGTSRMDCSEFMTRINDSCPPDSGIPGWDALTFAVYDILSLHHYKGDALKGVSKSIANAYQSVIQPEMNRLMLREGRSLVGEEIATTEKQLSICREEIDFQTDLIYRLMNGERLLLEK